MKSGISHARTDFSQIGDWASVLFEAIDDAIFVHDEHGQLLDVNSAACERLGYTRLELLSMSTREIDAPEFAAGFGERLRTQLEAGRFRGEGVHVRKDGRRLVVDINSSVVLLGTKKVVLAVMRDITERKKVEVAHADQTRLLEGILDNLAEAILVFDTRREVLMHNPPAEKLFGPAVRSGAYEFTIDNRVLSAREWPATRCLLGDSYSDDEYRLNHAEAPDGLWISLSGTPLRDVDGTIRGAILCARDITERRKAERRLRAQYLVTQTLAAGNDRDPPYERLLHGIGEALDWCVGILWTEEHSDRGLAALEVWQDPRLGSTDFLQLTRTPRFPITSELPGMVWQQKRPLFFRVEQSPWITRTRWISAAKAGLRMAFAFPVLAEGNPLGVLEFWSQSSTEPDDAILAMLQSIGEQLGQYIRRRQVEKELQDSWTLYESLVNTLPQNIFRKDRYSRLTFANKKYCETLGKTWEELRGKTDFDLFPEELAAKYVADDQEILINRSIFDNVEEHRLPEGKRIYVHVVKTPIIDTTGNVVGLQGIFWDVTERIESELRLSASEKRYRGLAEATMDGILLLDASERILLFNPAAEKMFGYHADEVLHRPLRDLLPLAKRSEHASDFEHLAASVDFARTGKVTELTAVRKDGIEFPVEIVFTVVGDITSTDRQYLAAIRDLTERNKIRSALVQSEKLASIGLLSAGVAHEINNPLAFVANNLVVMQRDYQNIMELIKLYEGTLPLVERQDPEIRKKIAELTEDIDLAYIQDNLPRIFQRTREGVDRVTRIVQSLRGLARTEAPRKAHVKLADILANCLEIIHGRFRKLGVRVEREFTPNLTLYGVEVQLNQVILNILVNAYQAIESAKKTEGAITVRVNLEGNNQVLVIEDNGPGIKPESVAKLFDPFFTTKDVGEGTGLGLFICHQIMAAHGGRIEVQSELGKGTAFRFV